MKNTRSRNARPSLQWFLLALVLAGASLVAACANPFQTNPASQSAPSAVARATSSASTDFRSESIYFILPSRFVDGDSTNNVPTEWCSYGANSPTITDPNDVTWRGDFKGLINGGLQYIKDLGFTAVWITPPVQNRGPLDYHGYHAWDFYTVDPRLESPGASYQDFINKAHELGLKVVQDIVLNHSGRYGIKGVAELKYNTDPTAAWGKDKNGLPLKDNPNWAYDGKTPNPDDGKIWSRANLAKMPSPYNANLALFNWPSTESFVSTSDITWFHHSGNGYAQGWDDTENCYNRAIADDCPDLNTESQAVRDYLVGAYKKYIDMGVDAFRVDTVKHMDRATVQYFIDQFKAYKPSLFIFGEVAQKRHELHQVEQLNPHWYTWRGAVGASENSGMAVIDFFAEGTFHGVFENDEGLGGITQAARYDSLYADPSTNITWLDNHDFGPDNNWERRYSGDAEGMATYFNFAATWRGIPTLYYGSEIQFQKGLLADIKGEAMTKTSLSLTGRSYYGDNINTASANPLYQHIKKMNLIRQAVPALQKGSWAWAGNPSNGNGVGYTRSYNGVTVAVGLAKNSSVDFSFTGLPSGTYVDAVTGKSVSSTGSLNFTVSGGSAGIFVLNGSGMVGALGAGFFQTSSNATGGGGGGGGGWTECYFRGTPNNWGATAMVKNPATGLWETTQTFGSDNPRFKISHYAGNWNEAYPATDRLITEGAGTYLITFNEGDKSINTVKQTTPSYALSGTVTLNGGAFVGVVVSAVNGGTSLSATTDASGNYSFSLQAGTWTVTPAKAGYAFSPVSQDIALSANRTGVNFSASPSGAFSWTECYFRGTPNNWGATAMSQNLSTGLWETTQTFGSDNPRFKISHYAGNWNEAYPASDRLVTEGAGTYLITFNDTSKAITVTKQTVPSYAVSGSVKLSGAGLQGVLVSAGGQSATTDANGAYSLSLPNGTHPMTLSKAGYSFSPSACSVTVSGAPRTGIDFTASAAPGLVVHFAEYQSASGYSIHCWNGLSGDFAMVYEGSINGRHWWKVSLSNAPASFLFCFVNSNQVWDGTNRSYTGQANEIYVLPSSATIYTTRP